MAEDTVHHCMCTFAGVDYTVSVSVHATGQLTVQVQQQSNADQWRNTFDANYIEDITFKTGNFKKFSVFVDMLESAILQTSDAVTLDLLTYADLEQLRAQKSGEVMRTVASAVAPSTGKKYLIVTYTAEFDRVHYPLPLPYLGKPDPSLLQDTIRQLQQDIDVLKQQSMKDYRQRELETLRRDYQLLTKEKEALEAEYVEFRRQLELSGADAAGKELKMLRGLVRSLEDELTESRSKHQRLAMKRSRQCRMLMDELDEVKARERSLKVRVKSVTNELALLRRKGSRAFPAVMSAARRDTSARSLSRDRSTSRPNSLTRSRDAVNHSNNSSVHNRSADKNSSRASNLSARSRDRSASFERRQPSAATARGRSTAPRPGLRATARSRSGSRERSQTDEISRTLAKLRMLSPASASARGAQFTRFDPTAYKAEKERQRKEIELKRKRAVRQRLSGSRDRDAGDGHRRSCSQDRSWEHAGVNGRRHSSRSPSVGSMRSVASSIDSLSDSGLRSDSELQHKKADKLLKSGRKLLTTSDQWNGHHSVYDKEKRTRAKILSSTPENVVRTRSALNHDKDRTLSGRSELVDGGQGDRACELTEIDERLSRLQQFMKDNLK